MKCGNPPKNLGMIDISPKEMMFWLYCPAKRCGELDSHLPLNIDAEFRDVYQAAVKDFIDQFGLDVYHETYVYATAKTLWVSGDYIGNRPGWHIDGFGTDDINYIWSDRSPTEFIIGEFDVSDDCHASMEEMEILGDVNWPIVFPDKHLLRLDNMVIHRSPADFEPGMRSFVKISFSKDVYNLEGNSTNPFWPNGINPNVSNISRDETRNHPHKEG